MNLQIRPVRLVASAAVTEGRLRARYSGSQTVHLDWHLARYDDLSKRLPGADLDELVIDTDDLTANEVAHRVLDHFGLPNMELHTATWDGG
ncbi:MAG: hypothetical protein ACR2F6_07170 [Mycobacteriales bacterium]